VRVLLLVNSIASSVTTRKRAQVRKILASKHDVEVAETSRRGHAELLARAAAEDDFDVVAVYAGDGTLNEAATGLLHTRTALAPVPGGSTNVYAKTLGYPRGGSDAARALVAALDRGSIERIGVGLAGERPFLFCAGIGFDASVIRRVERHSRWIKRVASHPLHVTAAVQTFFSDEGRRTRAHIMINEGAVDDGTHLSDVRFAIVSKSTPYTYLGRVPIDIAPKAGIDTRLSLTAFTALRATTLVGGAVSAMRTGKFLAHRRDVRSLDDLGRLRVYADTPFPYQVDGDDAGDTKELDIAFAPDALAVVLPRADL
jgi:diacylglycerol kinase family enzyme